VQRFPHKLNQPVRNFISGEVYRLERSCDVEFTGPLLEQLTAVCNEPEVLSWVREAQNRKAPEFTTQDASTWLEHGLVGWRQQRHFQFLIFDPLDELAGLIEIKGFLPVRQDIGYLASQMHKGFMTNALASLISHAWDTGYESFTARVNQQNTKSLKVLKNLYFETVKEESTPDQVTLLLENPKFEDA